MVPVGYLIRIHTTTCTIHIHGICRRPRQCIMYTDLQDTWCRLYIPHIDIHIWTILDHQWYQRIPPAILINTIRGLFWGHRGHLLLVHLALIPGTNTNMQCRSQFHRGMWLYPHYLKGGYLVARKVTLMVAFAFLPQKFGKLVGTNEWYFRRCQGH